MYINIVIISVIILTSVGLYSDILMHKINNLCIKKVDFEFETNETPLKFK